jgi:hypothetical protein
MCLKDGKKWVMASWFPYGPKTFTEAKKKLTHDLEGARHREPFGVAFVTNQKLTPNQKEKLKGLGGEIEIDLFHLERNVHILDRPAMAQVREQYVYIPAIGRPPVRVRAEVIGAARAFTRDDELLDLYVEWYEEQVRKESDNGWARVKAEEEEKARAEAAKIRAQAEKDRREALETRDQYQPINLAGIAMGSMPSFKFNFEDLMPKFEFPRYEPPLAATLLAGRYGLMEEPAPPPEPLSDEQINEKVATYRARLEARWESCKEYLAAVAWPALKFRIQNAEGFLTNVQVVLTFHGARGLDHEDIASFVWEKLEDPSWTEPIDPHSILRSMPAPPMRQLSNRRYPVEWDHDDNGDLDVKITLAQLRPHEVWTSDDDNVVLTLRDDSLGAVEVTYTITAQEHHDRVDGEPLTVPVEKVDILDSVKAAIDASEKPE